MTGFRIWLATNLLYLGMRIVPKDVRKTVRDIVMYHVPGALTEDEKRDVRRMAAEYRRSLQR